MNLNSQQRRKVICPKCGEEVSELLPKRGSVSCPICEYGWGWRRPMLEEEDVSWPDLDTLDKVFGLVAIIALLVIGLLALFGK